MHLLSFASVLTWSEASDKMSSVVPLLLVVVITWIVEVEVEVEVELTGPKSLNQSFANVFRTLNTISPMFCDMLSKSWKKSTFPKLQLSKTRMVQPRNSIDRIVHKVCRPVAII